MLCFMCVCLTIGAMPVKLVYNVAYGGEVVASVESKDVFYTAAQLAASKVNSENAGEHILEPEFKRVFTFADVFANAEDLSDVLLEHTDTIIDGYALCVNGETIAVAADSQQLDAALESAKLKYLTGADNESAEFVDEITISEGYFTSDDICDADSLSAKVSELDVRTVVTLTTDKSIGYDTVKQKSSSLAAGKTSVKQQGVNGVERTVESVVYLNGEEASRSVVSQQVVSEPVDKILVVGTGKTASKNYSSYGFVSPVNMSEIYITSYWGDGRGHKGLDLAGAKGTSIFAAKGGVVESVRNTSDYGKYLIVDHGNGVKTLYSHCSDIIVKAGESVVAGQTIAYIGRTGNATGNHLHFEIIINGTRVNPAPYLGIK